MIRPRSLKMRKHEHTLVWAVVSAREDSAAYLRGDTFDRMAFECGTARQKDADEEVIVE